MANKEHKITKISRKIYMQCISSNDYVKALSLLLFVKSKFPTSVIPNYSTYKLAKLTKLDKTTIKKYMDILGDLELLAIEGKKNDHVRFNKVRNKKTNFSLKNIDFSSVRTIELSIRTLLFEDIQKQKEYRKNSIELKNNPKNLKEYKKAKRELRGVQMRGDKFTFSDNGVSYKYLAKKMKCSYTKVSAVINYGVKCGAFICKHNFKLINTFDNHLDAWKYFQQIENRGQYRVKGCDLLLVQANSYIIL